MSGCQLPRTSCCSIRPALPPGCRMPGSASAQAAQHAAIRTRSAQHSPKPPDLVGKKASDRVSSGSERKCCNVRHTASSCAAAYAPDWGGGTVCIACCARGLRSTAKEAMCTASQYLFLVSCFLPSSRRARSGSLLMLFCWFLRSNVASHAVTSGCTAPT